MSCGLVLRGGGGGSAASRAFHRAGIGSSTTMRLALGPDHLGLIVCAAAATSALRMRQRLRAEVGVLHVLQPAPSPEKPQS